MTATLALFDRWKAHRGITSDRQAAAVLGISHAGPAQWRAGRNGAPSVIYRMAQDLGEDATVTILAAFSEAARDAEDRKTLAKLARKLGTACIALLMLSPLMSNGAQAAAEGHEKANQHIHYANWLRGLVQRLRRSWATCPAAKNTECSHLASPPATA